MKSQKGFLELTAATIFGLVALAASVVGVLLGQVALSRRTPPPPKAQAECISLTVKPKGETNFSAYESSYDIEVVVTNESGGDTQISAFGQENSLYISNLSGGIGVQTVSAGDSRTATITVHMNTSGDNNWLNKAGTTTQAKIYGTSRNVGDWGCYEDEVQTITFGTAAAPTLTLTPIPTPTGYVCSSQNCTGCCLNNTCYPGTSDTRCGKNGVLCTACPSGTTCTDGTCTTPTATLTPTPTTIPCPKPAAPSEFTVIQVCNPDGQTGKVRLTHRWKDNSNNENGFRVYYSTGMAGVDVQIDGDVSSNQDATYVALVENPISISTCQQRKMYSVASFNNCGESGRGTVTAPATNCCVTSTPTPTATPRPTATPTPTPTPTSTSCQWFDYSSECAVAGGTCFLPEGPHECPNGWQSTGIPNKNTSQCSSSCPAQTYKGVCCKKTTYVDCTLPPGNTNSKCDTASSCQLLGGVPSTRTCQATKIDGSTFMGVCCDFPSVPTPTPTPKVQTCAGAGYCVSQYSCPSTVGTDLGQRDCGVSYTCCGPRTDFNNDGVTNSLDWDVLVTGWVEGTYNALDASKFLHAWAAQAGI